MTSAQSAARFLAALEPKRAGQLKRGRKPPAPKYVAPTTTVLAKEWRDYLLTHLSRYTPKMPTQIWRDVFDDWGGDVHIRRVERGLRRLIAEGKIERVEGGYRRAR